MKTWCTIRPGPLYRHEAFVQGLKAAGHEVHLGRPASVSQCELLVIWNRYDVMHDLACAVEAHGGRVIVAENGYLGAGGTAPKWDVVKGPGDGHYYALAMKGHNGQGRWPEGDGSRWDALGIELKPWRERGEHVVVLANRSFGIPGRMMPMDWPTKVVDRLRSLTQRRVVLRSHPGNDEPQRPLQADLANAWAAVVWSSSAGAHALVAGIPVICEAPYWILKGAAGTDLRQIDAPPTPERRPHFERLAWAQWTLKEIASGEPFLRLLEERRG